MAKRQMPEHQSFQEGMLEHRQMLEHQTLLVQARGQLQERRAVHPQEHLQS